MAVELPEPLQWVLLLLAGCRWPEADEDRLRDMADQCRKAAEGLKDAGHGADAAIKKALEGQQGSAAESLGAFWTKFSVGKGTEDDPGRLTGVINALDGMGNMLEAMANSAETAKIQIVAQLGILAFEIATAEAEAPVTAGASLAQVPVMIEVQKRTVSQILKTLVKEMLQMAIKQAAQMAAINLLAQGIELAEGHRKSIDTKELGQNALGGAIGGAAGHALGAGIGGIGKKLGMEGALNSTAGKMATGAAVGVGADAITQFATTGKVDTSSLLGSGLSGGAGVGLHAGAAAAKAHFNAPKPGDSPHLDIPGPAAPGTGGRQDGPPTFTKPDAPTADSSYHGPDNSPSTTADSKPPTLAPFGSGRTSDTPPPSYAEATAGRHDAPPPSYAEATGSKPGGSHDTPPPSYAEATGGKPGAGHDAPPPYEPRTTYEPKGSQDAPPVRESVSSHEAPPPYESRGSHEAPPVRESVPAHDAPPAYEQRGSQDAPPVRESVSSHEAPPPYESRGSHEAPPVRESAPAHDAPPPYESRGSQDAPPVRESAPAHDVPPQRESGAGHEAPPPAYESRGGQDAPPVRESTVAHGVGAGAGAAPHLAGMPGGAGATHIAGSAPTPTATRPQHQESTPTTVPPGGSGDGVPPTGGGQQQGQQPMPMAGGFTPGPVGGGAHTPSAGGPGANPPRGTKRSHQDAFGPEPTRHDPTQERKFATPRRRTAPDAEQQPPVVRDRSGERPVDRPGFGTAHNGSGSSGGSSSSAGTEAVRPSRFKKHNERYAELLKEHSGLELRLTVNQRDVAVTYNSTSGRYTAKVAGKDLSWGADRFNEFLEKNGGSEAKLFQPGDGDAPTGFGRGTDGRLSPEWELPVRRPADIAKGTLVVKDENDLRIETLADNPDAFVHRTWTMVGDQRTAPHVTVDNALTPLASLAAGAKGVNGGVLYPNGALTPESFLQGRAGGEHVDLGVFKEKPNWTKPEFEQLNKESGYVATDNLNFYRTSDHEAGERGGISLEDFNRYTEDNLVALGIDRDTVKSLVTDPAGELAEGIGMGAGPGNGKKKQTPATPGDLYVGLNDQSLVKTAVQMADLTGLHEVPGPLKHLVKEGPLKLEPADVDALRRRIEAHPERRRAEILDGLGGGFDTLNGAHATDEYAQNSGPDRELRNLIFRAYRDDVHGWIRDPGAAGSSSSGFGAVPRGHVNEPSPHDSSPHEPSQHAASPHEPAQHRTDSGGDTVTDEGTRPGPNEHKRTREDEQENRETVQPRDERDELYERDERPPAFKRARIPHIYENTPGVMNDRGYQSFRPDHPLTEDLTGYVGGPGKLHPPMSNSLLNKVNPHQAPVHPEPGFKPSDDLNACLENVEAYRDTHFGRPRVSGQTMHGTVEPVPGNTLWKRHDGPALFGEGDAAVQQLMEKVKEGGPGTFATVLGAGKQGAGHALALVHDRDGTLRWADLTDRKVSTANGSMPDNFGKDWTVWASIADPKENNISGPHDPAFMAKYSTFTGPRPESSASLHDDGLIPRSEGPEATEEDGFGTPNTTPAPPLRPELQRLKDNPGARTITYTQQGRAGEGLVVYDPEREAFVMTTPTGKVVEVSPAKLDVLFDASSPMTPVEAVAQGHTSVQDDRRRHWDDLTPAEQARRGAGWNQAYDGPERYLFEPRRPGDELEAPQTHSPDFTSRFDTTTPWAFTHATKTIKQGSDPDPHVTVDNALAPLMAVASGRRIATELTKHNELDLDLFIAGRSKDAAFVGDLMDLKNGNGPKDHGWDKRDFNNFNNAIGLADLDNLNFYAEGVAGPGHGPSLAQFSAYAERRFEAVGVSETWTWQMLGKPAGALAGHPDIFGNGPRPTVQELYIKGDNESFVGMVAQLHKLSSGEPPLPGPLDDFIAVRDPRETYTLTPERRGELVAKWQAEHPPTGGKKSKGSEDPVAEFMKGLIEQQESGSSTSMEMRYNSPEHQKLMKAVFRSYRRYAWELVENGSTTVPAAD